MRTVPVEVCMVCGATRSSKDAMTEHTETEHGTRWPPAVLTRAADQRSFTGAGFSRATPWGRELR